MGEGVQVGVFDASPFDEPGGWRIPWAPFAPSLPLDICVSHPDQSNISSFTGKEPFCDHGLFVAGLVHAVAPKSEIHLIRVLNDDNVGSLSKLYSALKAFIDRMSGGEGGEAKRTVINLSLGVHLPPDLEQAGLPDLPALQDELLAALGQPRPAEWPHFAIPSLDALLSGAYEDDVVVVASAGNESICRMHAEPPLIPAAYPEVLGVAGSNIVRGRALFSNAGDVAAPSGDSRQGCLPRWLSLDKDQASRVTSLSMRISKDSGYAHWAGTSFAAPLVSGLAALVFEQNNAITSQKVYDKIKNRAIVAADSGLGAGIIDVPNTLKT
jgi:subtilisin family serine protease